MTCSPNVCDIFYLSNEFLRNTSSVCTREHTDTENAKQLHKKRHFFHEVLSKQPPAAPVFTCALMPNQLLFGFVIFVVFFARKVQTLTAVQLDVRVLCPHNAQLVLDPLKSRKNVSGKKASQSIIKSAVDCSSTLFFAHAVEYRKRNNNSVKK